MSEIDKIHSIWIGNSKPGEKTKEDFSNPDMYDLYELVSRVWLIREEIKEYKRVIADLLKTNKIIPKETDIISEQIESLESIITFEKTILNSLELQIEKKLIEMNKK